MLLSLVLLLSILSFSTYADEFMSNVEEQSAKYQTLSESKSAHKMALMGEHNELNSMLINLVPDENKTAEDYFILSNMLYEYDHKLSFDLMQKAYDLAPDEIIVLYEMGMHHHRNKNYAKAIEFYSRAQTTDFISEGDKSYALIADCYLRTGQYSKALDSWIMSDPKYNRINIEKAIYNIYADENSLAQRSDLHASIKTGKHHLFGNLIELDHSWKTDWWNSSVKENYLEYDLKYAAKVLGVENIEYKEILLLNDILSKSVNTTQFLKRLEELGIWGESKRLPKISVLTYYMVKKMTDLELVESEVILEAYEKELLKKKNNKTIDYYEFKILSFLYAVLDEKKLAALDYYAWENRNSKVGAESYFYNQLLKHDVDINALQQALQYFPNSSVLNVIHLKINKVKENETAIYAAMVAAEYPNLKNELSSHKLRAFFKSLAKKINHKSYTKNQLQ
jgi:hypothetical protein